VGSRKSQREGLIGPKNRKKIGTGSPQEGAISSDSRQRKMELQRKRIEAVNVPGGVLLRYLSDS